MDQAATTAATSGKAATANKQSRNCRYLCRQMNTTNKAATEVTTSKEDATATQLSHYLVMTCLLAYRTSWVWWQCRPCPHCCILSIISKFVMMSKNHPQNNESTTHPTSSKSKSPSSSHLRHLLLMPTRMVCSSKGSNNAVGLQWVSMPSSSFATTSPNTYATSSRVDGRHAIQASLWTFWRRKWYGTPFFFLYPMVAILFEDGCTWNTMMVWWRN